MNKKNIVSDVIVKWKFMVVNWFCAYGFYFRSYHAKKEEGKKSEKGHKFNEEGRFRKGHSTKGEHVIHKLDEFEQKKKFFDEDFNEDYDEGHGAFHDGHASKKGGSHKKGHHNTHFEHGESEKKGHGKKGSHHHHVSGLTLFIYKLITDIYFANFCCVFYIAGHKGEQGHEAEHGHKSHHGKKGESEHSKKFGHKKHH